MNTGYNNSADPASPIRDVPACWPSLLPAHEQRWECLPSPSYNVYLLFPWKLHIE